MSDPPLPGERYVNKGRQVRRQRFYDEALFMRQVSGSTGILSVWDIDDAHGAAPRWYAMPRARLLADVFGDASTVLDVVTHITALARTLAALAEQGIYHRDIKPANLFWYDGAPVLADFGIAAFAHRPAGLTRVGDKVRPANFMAPEMRSINGKDRGERADVYSLARPFSSWPTPVAVRTRRTGHIGWMRRSSASRPSVAGTPCSPWGMCWRPLPSTGLLTG
ncbi:protein kinase domain-containing protein [Streptomyces sp. T12]|uniref:protein kinase domain-containing protein n=1 Tax=Streptomyces sp. T12 TaxID=477697 RepID=UPI0011A3084A|nr:protein kinase [Streptomyces sp. T12]